ncbi:MAG: hypothetical protein JXR78_06450 [Victivallales bacterium]|nr:hypothetical protein [Victivallales bacterium]
MKPARIKQITTEMVIAWGVISFGVMIIDEFFMRIGVSCLSTNHAALSPSLALLSLICLISSLPGVLALGLTAPVLHKIGFNGAMACLWGFIPQILCYWYAGNLLGRFFVWIYTKFHPCQKAEPHDEATATGGQD